METITVELNNKKAFNLLKELEELGIIKIHPSKKEVSSKDKASKYRGFMSKNTADAFLKHIDESREEWEKRFSTK